MIRHAITTPGVGDPPGMRLDDCSSQRNLTDQGRQDARRLGEAFRARAVPVGAVLSSPWCRCIETARLAFGVAPETWAPLGNLFGRAELSASQVREMRARVGDYRAAPNLIMVTHGSTIQALDRHQSEHGGDGDPHAGWRRTLHRRRPALRAVGRATTPAARAGAHGAARAPCSVSARRWRARAPECRASSRDAARGGTWCRRRAARGASWRGCPRSRGRPTRHAWRYTNSGCVACSIRSRRRSRPSGTGQSMIREACEAT